MNRRMFDFSKIKCEPAPQVQTIDLKSYITQIMESLGFPEAFVTDESLIADFAPSSYRLAKARKILGVEVNPRDYVIEVAKRLKQKDSGGLNESV